MYKNEVQLHVIVAEDYADDERLDNLTIQLMRDLKNFDVQSIERASNIKLEKGAKGDPFTLGALILVAVPAILPPIIEFLKNWAIERRKIVIEAPNGAKLEFVSDKKYSEAELLTFIEKVNQISSVDANSTRSGYE